MEIRAAALADADQLAEVHVRAWQEGYRDGLLPDAYLDSLSVEERAQMWREALARPPTPKTSRLVATEPDVVGFIVVGPEAGQQDAARGEVFSLNVDPSAWGQGIGAALLRRGCAFLQDQGFPEAVLWTHRDSTRSRRFYEHHGWAADGSERTVEVLGAHPPEVRYVRHL